MHAIRPVLDCAVINLECAVKCNGLYVTCADEIWILPPCYACYQHINGYCVVGMAEFDHARAAADQLDRVETDIQHIPLISCYICSQRMLRACLEVILH